MVCGVIAANGISIVSLVATIFGGTLALLPKSSDKITPNSDSPASLPTQVSESTLANPGTTPKAFRLYRENDLNRIVAALLAKGSILIAGEEGSGKSVLVNAVIERLQSDGFMVAKVEPATRKQMLVDIAEQLGVETHSLEGKALTIDHLQIKIADFLKENTAFLIVDDCHNCDYDS